MKTSFVVPRLNVAPRSHTGFAVATPMAPCYFSTRIISQRTPRPNRVAGVTGALFFPA